MSQPTKLVRQCETSLRDVPGLRKLAVVGEGDALDIACTAEGGASAVVRCVEHLSPEDHAALATMISEGDFIYGAVVYEQGEAPRSFGLIESFHVSELDQLVARLSELREALLESG